MTYIEALNAFNLWLEYNTLAASSQLMYFKLLNLFNRAGWPEYVQVDNRRLMSMIDAETEKTAIRARDRLVEAGFLEYQKGRKGSPNRYRLTFHCKNYSVSDSENDSISDSKSDSKNDSKSDSHIKTKTKTNTPPISPPRGRRKKFIPPTVDEVRAYCQERRNGIDPEAFVAFYASKGWMIGKNRMEDWKQAVITWETKRKQERGGSDDYWDELSRR